MATEAEPTNAELDAWLKQGILDEHEACACGHRKSQHINIVAPGGRSFDRRDLVKKVGMDNISLLNQEPGGGSCKECKCPQYTFREWVR